MQHREYEKALLVAAAFQLSKADDLRELCAIVCVIRNWVVPRLGEAASYRSYTEAIANFLDAYPKRQLPSINTPSLIDPREGLLAQVDGFYNNSAADVTSSHLFPRGARYFARPQDVKNGDWIKAQVLDRQDEHPLIGVFGSQSFFA